MSVQEITNIISECKSHNLQYIDDWNQTALQHLELTNITFKRYDYPLFKDGISTMDIHQGSLGNCYLLAALSTLTRDPYLIEKLFYKEGMEYGVMGVWFYYNNEWNMEIIDTQIPSKYNYPIFSYTDGEYWVMLIEKAWAKLNGNYYNTIGGTTKDILHYLTNGISCFYDLVDDEIETQYENGSLWKTILEKYKNGSLLTCSSLKENLVENLTGEIDPSMIDETNGGLVDNHAYSILQVREVENNQLIQLYNPWGKYEWNGNWDDNDTQHWTPNMKQLLNYTNDDDGKFWMNWDDFFHNFCYLYITSNPYNHTISLSGEWKELESCGGLKENWIYNPKYSIEWKNDIENTKMVVNLSQTGKRKKGGGNWLYIIVDIIQNEDNNLKQTRDENNIIKSFHINSRIESIELDINPNLGKIWIIASLWEEGRIGNYSMMVSSPNDFDLLAYQTQTNEKLIKKEENMKCLGCKVVVDLMDKTKRTFKQCKWHQDCYKCQKCNKSMDTEDTTLYDIHKLDDSNDYGGYCLTCYEELYGDKCPHCSNTISRYQSFYNIDGNKVHEDCYTPYMISIADKCEYCNNAIFKIPNQYSGKYYTINGKKIHSECHQKYMDSIAEKCVVCNTNIYNGHYSVGNEKFHYDCLDGYRRMKAPTCLLCNNSIINQRYYTLTNNRSVHIQCYINYVNRRR